MFIFGVDYYPEQWPEERWETDALLMQQAGINTVRLAEFAWTKLEPRENHFEFEWLDRVIDILQRNGISVVLGTPTAAPPAWLVQHSPEILRVREDGVRVHSGTRRINCPSNPIYRQHSTNITSAMADHFGSHPAIIGWQIDNEFGDRCYCGNCRSEFQLWLQKKYGDLDQLNRLWGTAFWNQIYSDWGQIELPYSTNGSPPNPSLALDFYRFSSDSYVRFQQEQIEIVRSKCPKHFITHDMMGFGYNGINYHDLAKPLDFVSWNNYPHGIHHPRISSPSEIALSHDAMRGLKMKNFWVMEQQAGPSGWGTISPAPRPGELRLWAYQAIAHGADGLVFFRWRTARHGAEQFWHGLLEHDGRAGRRYREIQQMGLELKRIGDEITGTKVKSRVAILQSYDSRFAFQIQGNCDGFQYENHLAQIYSAVWRRNIGIDVISTTDNIAPYEVLIAPALHVLSEEIANNLSNYVKSGGTLLVTPRSGVKDELNVVVNRPLPGLLAEVCGVIVEEYDAIHPDTPQAIVFEEDGMNVEPVQACTWCDIIAPTSAEVLARYNQDYYAGKPAITRNRHGAGQAIYLGAFGSDQLYDALLGWILQQKGIKNEMQIPEGVEMTVRWHGDDQLIFLINNSIQAQNVLLGQKFQNLLDDRQSADVLNLASRDVAVLKITAERFINYNNVGIPQIGAG